MLSDFGIKLLQGDRRPINQCTGNGGGGVSILGSKQVICLLAEMGSDIHTGAVMNMEPGGDFERSGAPVKPQRPRWEQAM